MGKGAEPKATTKKGWKVLHQAAESGNLKLVQYLLEKGADPKETTKKAGQFFVMQ